ncbi:MAG TPA: tautomerase family protein, partial [Pseudonocardia sp.]|nr:tautomerase family protein [Pseudonocardia sp.]
MPVYTCTTTMATLGEAVTQELAAEITRIHAAITHVPTTFVNVIFHELPTGDIFTDPLPAHPLLINGWARDGHPAEETTRLALDIAHASTLVTGLPPERVLVVIQNSPARFAVEGGRVLPEPGQEGAWL